MKTIKLTGGSTTLVDDDVFLWASKMKWRNSKGYAKSGGAYNSVYLHNMVLPPAENLEIDHINRDPLDNRRNNLRVVDSRQNKLNRGAHRNNKSGYKGVYKRKQIGNKLWVAEIKFKDKRFCSYFSTLEEAIDFYNEKSLELHGEYGYKNTP